MEVQEVLRPKPALVTARLGGDRLFAGESVQKARNHGISTCTERRLCIYTSSCLKFP